MTDCVESLQGGFRKVEIENDCNNAYTLGIKGAWFVGNSWDYFTTYEDNNFTGIEVYNCCGKFILTVKK